MAVQRPDADARLPGDRAERRAARGGERLPGRGQDPLPVADGIPAGRFLRPRVHDRQVFRFLSDVSPSCKAERSPARLTPYRRGLRLLWHTMGRTEDIVDELVLVTGGSGYIGGWCVAELLRRGYQVRTT